nr:MAG TPA: virion assembly protein [Caudoviricetes sp.]
MGLFSGIKKAVKKVAKIATFGAYRGGGGGGAPEAPTPAPELELTNPEGEAEKKKEETEKVQLRKGKKGLRIKKAGNADVSAGAGRNLV